MAIKFSANLTPSLAGQLILTLAWISLSYAVAVWKAHEMLVAI